MCTLISIVAILNIRIRNLNLILSLFEGGLCLDVPLSSLSSIALAATLQKNGRNLTL
jgi:hypothetical protein